MKLYTPGHGLVADTVIMHGIVRILAAAGVHSGVVRRVGERYEIEVVDGIEVKVADTEIAGMIFSQASAYSKALKNTGTAPNLERLMLGKLDAANINFGIFSTWVRDLTESLLEADINAYAVPNHKSKYKEGRTTSKSLYTLYLTFTPIYGKYTIDDYKATDRKKYGVCASCFAMANIGLLYGVAVMARAAGGNLDVILLTPAPASETSLEDVLILQRLTEDYLWLKNEMPTAAAPLYWLSVGETLYAVDTPMELITWRLRRTGNFQRAVDSVVTNLSKLLDFVSELKWQSPKWPLCAQELVDTDNTDVLADMTTYALYGGDHYTITRRLTSALHDRENGPRLRKVCEADKIAATLATWRQWAP